jgi:hypothetical protein
MAVTERPTACLTLRSSPEANVLGEQQLQNRCALSLTSCSGAGLTPKVRMKKCLMKGTILALCDVYWKVRESL